MLRDEYRIKRVTKVRADTLEELCNKLEDVNAGKALETIKAYNKAVMTEVKFDPNVKDGRGTRGWRCRSQTGPTPSMSRRSKPMR